MLAVKESSVGFRGAGAANIGDAVTSLGSTLAIKMLSEAPVDDAACGLYSHRLGALSQLRATDRRLDSGADIIPAHMVRVTCTQLERFGVCTQTCLLGACLPSCRSRTPNPRGCWQLDVSMRCHAGIGWLVGGASNSGGAVLRQHFSDDELAALTPQLRPHEPTGLDYYPLPCKGERFPVRDDKKEPVLSPRPDDDAVFLQGAPSSPVRYTIVMFVRQALSLVRKRCASGQCRCAG